MIICLSSLNLCALALFIDLNTNYHVCILCVSYCHTPFGSLSYVPAVGFTTQQAAAAAVDPMQHTFVWITRVSLVLFTHTHTHTKRIMGWNPEEVSPPPVWSCDDSGILKRETPNSLSTQWLVLRTHCCTCTMSLLLFFYNHLVDWFSIRDLFTPMWNGFEAWRVAHSDPELIHHHHDSILTHCSLLQCLANLCTLINYPSRRDTSTTVEMAATCNMNYISCKDQVGDHRRWEILVG